MTNEQKYATLHTLVGNTDLEKIAHAVACEFSAEDDTPTLHVDLWRGIDLSDLSPEINELEIVAEGHWDGGRTYSLQLA